MNWEQHKLGIQLCYGGYNQPKYYSTIATSNKFLHSFTLNFNYIQSYGPIFSDTYMFVLYQKKAVLLIHQIYFAILQGSLNKEIQLNLCNKFFIFKSIMSGIWFDYKQAQPEANLYFLF